MTVTRVKARCRTKDCPWPFDEEIHVPWCRGIAGHVCFGGAYHQHRPKKGMGGHNPDAKIVGVICAGMSDAVDNGQMLDGRRYEDQVFSDGARPLYRIGVKGVEGGATGWALLLREIPPVGGGKE